MRKFAVILYPDFSLQEITCLTSALTVWFGETIDFIASENKEYRSRMLDGYAEIRDALGNKGASKAVASAMIADLRRQG